MKKLIKLVIFILIVGGIYMYFFNKKLPSSIASKVMDSITEVKFMENKDDYLTLNNIAMKIEYKETIYDNGFKQVNKLEDITVVKTGSKDDFKVSVDLKVSIGTNHDMNGMYYVKDGKYFYKLDSDDAKEIELEKFLTEISGIYYFFLPIDTTTGGIKYGEMLKKADKAEQLHLDVTGFASDDKVSVQVTYDLKTKTITEYESVINNYDKDGNIVSYETYKCTFYYE